MTTLEVKNIIIDLYKMEHDFQIEGASATEKLKSFMRYQLPLRFEEAVDQGKFKHLDRGSLLQWYKTRPFWVISLFKQEDEYRVSNQFPVWKKELMEFVASEITQFCSADMQTPDEIIQQYIHTYNEITEAFHWDKLTEYAFEDFVFYVMVEPFNPFKMWSELDEKVLKNCIRPIQLDLLIPPVDSVIVQKLSAKDVFKRLGKAYIESLPALMYADEIHRKIMDYVDKMHNYTGKLEAVLENSND